MKLIIMPYVSLVTVLAIGAIGYDSEEEPTSSAEPDVMSGSGTR